MKELKLKVYKNLDGKNNGWVYQFIDDEGKSMNIPCCCKDFLQDVVYTELTGDKFSVHNYSHTKKGFIDKSEILRLAIYYKEKKVDINKLSSSLLNFLNKIENQVKFRLSTIELSTFNNFDVIIINFSKEWLVRPHIFSLFTLLCRFGVNYNGEEILQYIKFPGELPDNCDSYLIKGNDSLKFIQDFLELGKYLEQPTFEDLKEYQDNRYNTKHNTIHESGIFSLINMINQGNIYVKKAIKKPVS